MSSGFNFDPNKGYMPLGESINDGAYYPQFKGLSQVQTYYEATGFTDGDGNTPTGGLVQAVETWGENHVVHWDAVNTPLAPSNLELRNKTITGIVDSTQSDGAVTRGFVETLVTTGGVDVSTLGDPNDVITINPTETAFLGRKRSWLEHGLELWDMAVNYSIGDRVLTSNGLYFQALTNNLNQDPLTNPTDWVFIYVSPGGIGEIKPIHESLLTSLQTPITTGTSDITADVDATSSVSYYSSEDGVVPAQPLSNAFDGNTATFAQLVKSGGENQQTEISVSLYFSSTKNIKKIEIYPRDTQPIYNFKNFQIEYSTDTTDGINGSWFVSNYNLNTSDSVVQWESFDVHYNGKAIAAKGVRIKSMTSFGVGVFALIFAEIKIYENTVASHLIDSSNSFSSVSPGDLLKADGNFTKIESVSANDLILSDDIIDNNSNVSYEIFKQIVLDGWVRMNGQTLSNPSSPLNGKVIPNLNNDTSNPVIGNGLNYIVGSTVSGNYLEYRTGKHSHQGTTFENGNHDHSTTTSSDTHSHTVGYYNQTVNTGSAIFVSRAQNYPGPSGAITSSDTHSHTVTITSPGRHMHELSADTLTSGNAADIPRMDSFTVVMIMKVEL